MTTYFVIEKDRRIEAETLEQALEKYEEQSSDSVGLAELWRKNDDGSETKIVTMKCYFANKMVVLVPPPNGKS